MKIIICDPISPKGIALLQQRPEFEVVVLPKRLPEAELLPIVADATALGATNTPGGWRDGMAENGILMQALYGTRLVTHLDVSAADIDQVVAAVKSYFAHSKT